MKRGDVACAGGSPPLDRVRARARQMDRTSTDRLAVLMYHDVSGTDEAAGYTVSRAGLEAALGLVRAADGDVACEITFDDGHAGTFAHGLPILCASTIRATLFVTVGFLGCPGFMDREMLRAWHAAGQRVGSHAMTHRPLDALPRAEVLRELSESKARLEDLLGAAVDAFSFPGGNDTAALRRLAHELGYARVYTSEPAFARASSPVRPRFAMRARTPLEAIRALRAGRIARPFQADRLRWLVKRAVGGRLYVSVRSRFRRATLPQRSLP